MELKYPIGYEDFHSDEFFNFTLNRWYSGGGARYQDFKKVGKEIKDFTDWECVMTKLGEEAIKERRFFNAFTYFRGAEFFVNQNNPNKDKLYHKSMDLFYKAVQDDDNLERIVIPYQDGKINVLKLITQQPRKDTVLIHGGYDSFNEEFYPLADIIRKNGYDVIIFEGPGQGRTLHEYDLKMVHEWEKPTAVVLDYFGLDDVSLIGISLGGYLAARAAAYEPRIKRVILYDLIYDLYEAFFSKMSLLIENIIKSCLKLNLKNTSNKLETRVRKERGIFFEWLLDHGFYIFGVDNMFDYFKEIQKYNTRDISAKIKQDVLVLAGEDDIYTQFFGEQIKELKNVKSIRSRIFTKDEHASQHCQIGNLKLVLDYIVNWLDEKNVGYTQKN